MNILKTHKTFNGKTQFWSHSSSTTKTEMKFSTFIPEGPIKGCLIWLSGLTCTEENFITKAGAQRELAKQGLMVVCPDTSPRGLNLPHEHDSYDFGSGASFYLNATVDGYKDHYLMYDYISKELYGLINSYFKCTNISIFGHSMGGHGALVIGLRESAKFKSVSAFAPVVNPTQCSWGDRAFKGYLGDNFDLWKTYDSCELLKSGHKHPQTILIHQGTEDEFLHKGNLQTDHWTQQAAASKQATEVIMAEGYDHSYYFISTFIDQHIQFHAKHIL